MLTSKNHFPDLAAVGSACVRGRARSRPLLPSPSYASTVNLRSCAHGLEAVRPGPAQADPAPTARGSISRASPAPAAGGSGPGKSGRPRGAGPIPGAPAPAMTHKCSTELDSARAARSRGAAAGAGGGPPAARTAPHARGSRGAPPSCAAAISPPARLPARRLTVFVK